jgi:hypothetical protein
MPVFKAPQYSKVINPKTGKQEPSYTFDIEFESFDDGISFITESSNITLQQLQSTILENVEWWKSFIQHFLQASSKFFTKQYTIDQINKITKHTLNESDINKNNYESSSASVYLLPKSINISCGFFTVNWKYTVEPISIDIPDITEEITNTVINPPVINQPETSKEIQEVNIDELPTGWNTENTLEIESPAKYYEKQRVKEARLKAKLAVYKAQRQMAKYYEKYGDDISDSDTEVDSSDSEDESEEEVQL